MVACMQDALVQQWYKAYGTNNPISDWIEGPFHDTETISDTV